MNATTVTLTTSGTVYNIYTLMKAIETTISPSYNQLIITADPGNTGNVYLGDSTVSSSIFGFKLPTSASANFPAIWNGGGLEEVYVVADANTQKLDIIARRM